MEKRAVIAIALSVAILVIWTLYFQPRPPAPPEGTSPATEAPQVEPSTEQPPSRVAPARVAPARVAPARVAPEREEMPRYVPRAGLAPEQQYPHETDSLVAVLTTRGAALRSVLLKEYFKSVGPDALQVEMISGSGDTPWPLSLQVRSGSGGIEPWDDYKLESHQGSTFEFLRETQQLEVRKVFRFGQSKYAIDLDVSVQNRAASGQDIEIALLWTDGGNRPVQSSSRFGRDGPVALYGGKIVKKDRSDEEISEAFSVAELRWLGYETTYFISAVVPDYQTNGEASMRKRNGVVTERVGYSGLYLEPGESWKATFRVYSGPKTVEDLREAGGALEEAVDYGFFGVIAKPLILFMNFINRFFGNYGVAIIILTIIVKLVFYPLTAKSFKSMKEMQKLQQPMKDLKEKYKSDKERLNREMLQLYKTHKVNPLSGCLPMLIQFPVLIALYQGLGIAIELRHAPFFLWINDLSAPESIWDPTLAGYSFSLRVLPLIMGVSMVLQQRMTPTSMDPTQAKMMMLMPVVFTFIFWGFPSGLVLYWLVNNILSILQQYFINKRGR